MSDAGSGSSGQEIWRPKINPWIIAVAVSLAAFMEVLDTSIAAIEALAIRLMHAGLSMHTARQQAVGRLYAFVQAQAAVLSYVDVYWLLSAASVTMFLSSILLKRNEPGRGENVSVH
jgi:hypothetical protein